MLARSNKKIKMDKQCNFLERSDAMKEGGTSNMEFSNRDPHLDWTLSNTTNIKEFLLIGLTV